MVSRSVPPWDSWQLSLDLGLKSGPFFVNHTVIYKTGDLHWIRWGTHVIMSWNRDRHDSCVHVEPHNFHVHAPKHVIDAVSIVFGRCVRWARNTLFCWCSCTFRSCLALGSRPSESRSSGILWEILIRETLIDASCIDKNTWQFK